MRNAVCLIRPNKSLKPFSKKLLTRETLYEKFQCIASLYQKTVSTSSLKNLQKSAKCHCQTLRAFTFDLKVASKSFSNCFTSQHLNSNQFKNFDLLFQKMAATLSLKNLQKGEMPFPNHQNILLLPQASFKAFF